MKRENETKKFLRLLYKVQPVIFIFSLLLLLPSVASAGTWTQQSVSPSLYSIASSADGMKLAAISGNRFSTGDIYTSTNGGATWIDQTAAGARNWISIASSADGTKLAAIVYGGDIYTSIDSGVTWTDQTTAGSRYWSAITSSYDGTKLAAVVNYGADIYTSTDSGASWTDQTAAGSQYWSSIASSADGVKLAATEESYLAPIHHSTDGGVTWTTTSLPSQVTQGFSNISSSADGMKLVAVANGGDVYTSTDSGVTWTDSLTYDGSHAFYSVTSSADGMKLAAATTGGDIYTSTDGGANWTDQTALGLVNWTGTNITSSADGTKLFAVDAVTFYTYTSGPYDPALVTNPATTISLTTATLNGSILGNGGVDATQSGFAYSTNATLTSGVSTTTLGAQTGNASFSSNISSLTGNTMYYFRSYATNSQGTGFGLIGSFTTSSTTLAPTVLTPSISSITTTTAVASSTITSTGGASATVRGFGYGLTTSYSLGTTTEGGTFSKGPFTASLSGLTCNTTYHVRSYATNSGGTGYSGDQTFTTSSCPDVTPPTVSLTAPTTGSTVHGSSVSLAATASDNVAVAGIQFKLDTNTAIGSEDTTNPYGVTWDSTGVVDGSHTILAVARDTSNNYATSTVTITVDNIAPVRSAGSPTGTLTAGTSGATLSLTTNENATCKYSTSSGTAYSSMTAFTTTGGTSHSTVVSGLSNGTSYSYYVKCQDLYSNTNASDYTISFSVVATSQATVTTSTASSITQTGATLNGVITATGGADATQSGFAYGTDPTLESVIATTTLGSQTGTASLSSAISSLGPNTVYYFRAYVTNPIGTRYGSIQSFTTSIVSTPVIAGTSHGESGYVPGYGPQADGCSGGVKFNIFTRTPCSSIIDTFLPPTTTTFTTNLRLGMTDFQVKLLQQYLNTHGFSVAASGLGSLDNETTKFGYATQAALIKFQKAKKITPASGFFGPLTRAYIGAH